MVAFSSDARVAEVEMQAILFVLVAFAYADGHFDASERNYIRDTVDTLIDKRAEQTLGPDRAAWSDLVPRWKAHFYHAIASIEYEVRSSLTESLPESESAGQYCTAKLKLRCFEFLQRLGEQNRAPLFDMVDGLIKADGRVHPAEQRLREELEALFFDEEPTRLEMPAPTSLRAASTLLDPPRPRPLRDVEHPFFRAGESCYSDTVTVAQQVASDMDLIRQFEARLWEQRSRGKGALAGAQTFTSFAGREPFLDGSIHVVQPPPGKDYDVLVFGDLHGCYSCLKAGLMQDDFFGRVEEYRRDPQRAPFPMVVFLGDYIDRGYYSYDGVLRNLLRLYLAAPEHVVVLRGNHEHYYLNEGRIEAPLRPAEAIASIAGFAPRALLEAHMRLFDSLPSMLVIHRTLFVHGGIPREDTAAAKLVDLAALNDPELRIQMTWSDPSDADEVPLELQRKTMRFPFGRGQFRRFMSRIGCTTMIRGHERVVEGVRAIYRDPNATLLTVFSAGGATNDDLPPQSNYREVTPMALSFRHRDGVSRVTPFPIEYARYLDPAVNGFAAMRARAPR